MPGDVIPVSSYASKVEFLNDGNFCSIFYLMIWYLQRINVRKSIYTLEKYYFDWLKR